MPNLRTTTFKETKKLVVFERHAHTSISIHKLKFGQNVHKRVKIKKEILAVSSHFSVCRRTLEADKINLHF